MSEQQRRTVRPAAGGGPARIIIGSGRSGTTWLLDALAVANSARTVFEPLHPVCHPVGARYAYACLGADSEAPELERFLAAVLHGRFRSLWTDFRARWDHLLPETRTFASLAEVKLRLARWRKLARECPDLLRQSLRTPVLVKCIRANLMLEWLLSRFQARVLFIIRHPGAVVESQLNSGYPDWQPAARLACYRRDTALRALLPAAYREALATELPPAAALTLIWCIENELVLDRVGGRVTLVHYERLVADRASAEEWARCATGLDLSPPAAGAELDRPSQQASGRWFKGGQQGAARPDWRSLLSAEHRRQMQDIYERLGGRLYHMDDSHPLRDLPAAADCRRHAAGQT